MNLNCVLGFVTEGNRPASTISALVNDTIRAWQQERTGEPLTEAVVSSSSSNIATVASQAVDDDDVSDVSDASCDLNGEEESAAVSSSTPAAGIYL